MDFMCFFLCSTKAMKKLCCIFNRINMMELHCCWMGAGRDCGREGRRTGSGEPFSSFPVSPVSPFTGLLAVSKLL